MLEVQGVAKLFGLRPVLKSVTFSVAPGECVALLGPNGAGKTTLLRILATLSRPTAGLVKIAGYALPGGAAEARRRLGVVSHQPLLYTDLTAEENLRLYAQLYDVPAAPARITFVLEQVGLAHRRRDLVRTFSRGMQQRLAIARATLPDPEVVLFDEPYTGLDPTATQMLDDMVRDMQAQGRTLLLVLHDLAHARALAERVLILAKGRMAYEAACAGLDLATLTGAYAAAVAS